MSLDSRDPAWCPPPAYAFPGGALQRDVVVFLDERPGCRHDVGPSCELHGCPQCQNELEQKPWIDPCETCKMYRDQMRAAFVALNPAIQCELECGVHCDRCNACMKTGRVCRICKRCVDCEDEYGACSQIRWDRVVRREVWYPVHTLWDPVTQRWRR